MILRDLSNLVTEK